MRDAEQMTLAQAHSATSKAAGRSVTSDKARMQTLVYQAIRRAPCPNDTNKDGDCGRNLCPVCGHGSIPGLTDEEGVEVTGLAANTYRPRRVELVQQGRVRDSGHTRSTKSGRKAVVWEAFG